MVYWWTDNGGIRAPGACWLDYWNGSNYVSVPNPAGLGVSLNQYNTTTFTPVTTDRVRLTIHFRGGFHGHSGMEGLRR